MNRTTFSAFLVIYSCAAAAGPVSDTFSKGMFGVPWDADRKKVETALPGGKWKSVGGSSCYAIGDGRPVFGVARSKKDDVTVCMSSAGTVAGFSVHFPSSDVVFGQLLATATENLGAPAPENRTMDQVSGLLAAARTSWGPDDRITVAVIRSVSLRATNVLQITRTASTPADRKSLGIE